MGVPSKQACALLGSLALAAGVAGCGETVSTGTFSGEDKAVAQRVSEFQHHATAASETAICTDDLTSRLRAEIVSSAKAANGKGCAEALKQQLKQVEDVSMTVKSVTVHGTSAAAVVRSTWSGKPCNSTLTLEKQPSATSKGGSPWRISGMQTSCT